MGGDPKVTGKVYLGHSVFGRVDDQERTIDAGDPGDINGTNSPYIPRFVGGRLAWKPVESDPDTFTLVGELMAGNMATSVQPVGLKNTIPHEKFALYVPELSAETRPNFFHAKVGFFASPFTIEPAYGDNSYGFSLLTHSDSFKRVALNFLQIQAGAGDAHDDKDKHVDVTVQLNAGPDRAKISDGNFSGGLSVTMTPVPEFSLTGHLFFGEQDGQANGLFEGILMVKPSHEWTLHLDAYTGWQFASNPNGTMGKQQWESALAYLTYQPSSIPLAVMVRGEYIHDDANDSTEAIHQGNVSLAAGYQVWSGVKNNKGDDSMAVKLRGEYRHNFFPNHRHQEVLSAGADIVYNF